MMRPVCPQHSTSTTPVADLLDPPRGSSVVRGCVSACVSVASPAAEETSCPGVKSSRVTRTNRPLNFVSSKACAARCAAASSGMIAVASPDSTTTFEASTPRNAAMEATSELGGTGLTLTLGTRPSWPWPPPPPPSPPPILAFFAAFFASRAAASSGDRASRFSFLACLSSDPIRAGRAPRRRTLCEDTRTVEWFCRFTDLDLVTGFSSKMFWRIILKSARQPAKTSINRTSPPTPCFSSVSSARARSPVRFRNAPFAAAL